MWGKSSENRQISSCSKERLLQDQSVSCESRITLLGKFIFSISYTCQEWEEKLRLLLAAGKKLCWLKQKWAITRILHRTWKSPHPSLSLSLSVSPTPLLSAYLLHSSFCTQLFLLFNPHGTWLSTPHNFTYYTVSLEREMDFCLKSKFPGKGVWLVSIWTDHL